MEPIRLLIVDTSPEFLEAAASLLSAHPHAHVVGLARTGAEALRLIGPLAPDLVLVDLLMPGMDGLTVTRRIKAMPSPPAVVVLTYNQSAELRQQALDAGAIAFVNKERIVDDVFAIIDARIAQSRKGPAGV